jgi:hypothetical protein
MTRTVGPDGNRISIGAGSLIGSGRSCTMHTGKNADRELVAERVGALAHQAVAVASD